MPGASENPKWLAALRLVIEDLIRAGHHRISDVLIDLLDHNCQRDFESVAAPTVGRYDGSKL